MKDNEQNFSIEHPDQRSSRPWAIIKDEILNSFLPVYVISMLKRRKIPLLIDAYAGPGKYTDGTFGSPIIMLRTAIEAFNRIGRIDELNKVIFIFCEREEEYLFLLNKHIDAFLKLSAQIKIEQIHTKHIDSGKELGGLALFIEKKAQYLSPFLYLDPWGLKGVESNLVFKFLSLREKGIEVEILLRFPPADIYRFYKNPKFGGDWIKEVVGEIKLSNLDRIDDTRKRNLKILKRYVAYMFDKYKEFGKDLFFVAIEIPGNPPYYMVFFSENSYGSFAMGNAMINGLRKYLKADSPLLGAEALKPFEASDEEMIKFMTKIKMGRRTGEPFTISELVATYNRENLFPVLFSQPRGTGLRTIQHVLKKLKQDGVILDIQGKFSEAHSLVYL
jgi:three-Cys-motif partner protein